MTGTAVLTEKYRILVKGPASRVHGAIGQVIRRLPSQWPPSWFSPPARSWEAVNIPGAGSFSLIWYWIRIGIVLSPSRRLVR